MAGQAFKVEYNLTRCSAMAGGEGKIISLFVFL